MIHILPDIHGQHAKLAAGLDRLGWRRRASGWHGPSPGARLVFLGDFIDRGPEQKKVLATVRSLLDSGKADAVMGNHEFNAILFHTETDSGPLRPHSPKNLAQHAAFIAEFPLGSAALAEAVAWMRTLPIWLETGGIRAVHACWHGPTIAEVSASLPEARLDEAILNRPGLTASRLFDDLERLTKGPETRLPEGFGFHDGGGHWREMTRIAWWRQDATSWRDLAATGVPDPVLPEGDAPRDLHAFRYVDPVPVFFGHYWMTGVPVVEAPYALCLDYSAGIGGPLLAYRYEPGDTQVRADRIQEVG
ncbi:MAG: metallophosphoesterase [Rhodobacteraceae bacterium]|nr:metallophosphoesterase [Paracoccaceae bacterium]